MIVFQERSVYLPLAVEHTADARVVDLAGNDERDVGLGARVLLQPRVHGHLVVVVVRRQVVLQRRRSPLRQQKWQSETLKFSLLCSTYHAWQLAVSLDCK